MPVQIKFYTMEEKQPRHEQKIVWIRKYSSWGYDYYEHEATCAVYLWTQVDDKDCPTGTFIPYNEGDDLTSEGFRLEILLDGHTATYEDLWVDAEEYANAFPSEPTDYDKILKVEVPSDTN